MNSLLTAATVGSFGDLAAAVLPCFWIYREVGMRMAATPAAGNPYQAWIDTYADEAFQAAVLRMRGVVDDEVAKAGAAQRASMRAHFLQSCRYEWMFWDAAWRMEGWPV